MPNENTFNKSGALNPEMLILARESRGYTQSSLAAALNISQGKISKIESGVLACGDEFLADLSRILHYPETFFTQSRRLLGLPVSVHGPFRKKSTLGKRDVESIQASINIHRHHVEELLQSADITAGFSTPALDPDEYDGDIPAIANIVRRHLMLPDGPINDLIGVVEDAGCIVIACNFGTDKVDGLSLRLPGIPPLIFIRDGMPGDRQRFTIAHEYGHIVMHSYPNPNMEEQANHFASEFLMPTKDIKSSLKDLTIPKLANLKAYWKVSMQALLYKASSLRIITESQNKYLWMQLSSAGYRRQEPISIPAEEPHTLQEILNYYRTELSYSDRELAAALRIFEDDFVEKYCPGPRHLRLVQ